MEDTSVSPDGEVPPVNGKRLAIHHTFIQHLDIQLYDSNSGSLGVWCGVGTVSTLTHGFFLVFTGPIWLGATIPVVIGVDRVLDCTEPR